MANWLGKLNGIEQGLNHIFAAPANYNEDAIVDALIYQQSGALRWHHASKQQPHGAIFAKHAAQGEHRGDRISDDAQKKLVDPVLPVFNKADSGLSSLPDPVR